MCSDSSSSSKNYDDQLIEKSKLYLDILRSEYQAEVSRFAEIDNKSFRSLAVTGVLLGIFSLSFTHDFVNLDSLGGSYNMAIKLLVIFSISLCSTWGLLLKVVWPTKSYRIFLDKNTMENYDNDILPNIYAELCLGYSKALSSLTATLECKACFLKYANITLCGSVLSYFALILLAIFNIH